MGNLRILLCVGLIAAFMIPLSAMARQVSEGERLGKTCAGCHGSGGYAPGEYIARISGQNKEYLTKIMADFAAGKRPGSVEMGIISKGYTSDGLNALAEYYSGKPWKNTTNKIVKAEYAAGKKVAATNGCLDCHGVKGLGSQETPRLAGQNKGYLYEALKRYKAGQIQSDEMAGVKDLSDKKLEQAAEYFAGLK